MNTTHYALLAAIAPTLLGLVHITPDCGASVWAAGVTVIGAVTAWVSHNSATNRNLISGSVK